MSKPSAMIDLLKKYDLALLALIISALNLPLWSNRVWLGDYTLMTFFNFYSVYNDFFLYHEIPHWFPFGAYGVPANYWQFHQLSPPCYFIGLLGWVLRIKNVLILFKFSAFLEQVILLLGTYLLGKQLFERKAALYFSCLGITLSSFWFYENFWNLRFYYLTPFTLYFLVLFVKKKDSFCFWMAGILFAISLIGNLPYFFGLHFIVFFIFICILLINDSTALRSLTKMGLRSWIAFCLCVATLLICFFFFWDSLQGIYVHKLGRSASQWYATPLKDFLTFGLGIEWGKFRELLLANPMARYDSMMHAGILTLFFALYALFRARNMFVIAVMAVILYLTLFSVGTASFVAEFTYRIFFPIRLFRYIGQVGSLIKLFLIILSGFGVSAFLNDLSSATNKNNHRIFIAVSLSAFLFLFAGWIGFNVNSITGIHWLQFGMLAAAAILMIALLAFKHSKPITFQAIIIIALCSELLLQQSRHIHHILKTQSRTVNSSVIHVHQYSFQNERTWGPLEDSGRTRQAYELVFSKPGFWMEAYDFVKFDPCLPAEPTIYEPAALVKLTDLYFNVGGKIPLGLYLTQMTQFRQDSRAEPFLFSLGCQSPKLKLIENPIIVSNRTQAELTISKTTRIDETPVIVKTTDFKPDSSAIPKAKNFSVAPLSFRSNELSLSIEIPGEKNYWVYYADSYHSNWKAWADNQEVPVSEANLNFKAIELAPGVHNVRFRFVPDWRDSLIYWIAMIGILFCIAILATLGYCITALGQQNPS